MRSSLYLFYSLNSSVKIVLFDSDLTVIVPLWRCMIWRDKLSGSATFDWTVS